MIIEKTIVTEHGVTFNRLTSPNEFWAVGYTEDNVIRLITPEDVPMSAGSKVNGQLEGFGADTYAELLVEIENRGLVWPESE